ncbi:hypothetical protein BGZ63DRAFT_396920 [Mariannaea sp. PMI_226]|nr:hypothetical protein BGZ63DRAFT_396920 [Mariannaea sp. PMI_226]
MATQIAVPCHQAHLFFDPPAPGLRSALGESSWPSAVSSAATQAVPVANTAATWSPTLPAPGSERHYSPTLKKNPIS